MRIAAAMILAAGEAWLGERSPVGDPS